MFPTQVLSLIAFALIGVGQVLAKEPVRPNTGAGSDISADLRRAFFDAAHDGDLEVAARLLAQRPLLVGARPDNEHRTPLIMATWNNRVAMVKFLIANGADLEAEDFVWGASALGWSGWFGRPQVAAVLIEAGAEVNHPNRGGVTPLGSALSAKKGNVNQGAEGAKPEDRKAVIDLLKEKGGTPRAKRTRPWPIVEGWANIE